MTDLKDTELEKIEGGNSSSYGSALAGVGLAAAFAGVGIAASPVLVAAAAGYGVALVVVGMAAFVEGAWFALG